MIDQLVTELKLDSDVASSSYLTPLTHSNGQVSENICNKLIDGASDSGYASCRDNFGLKAPLRLNALKFNSDSEILIDRRNARLSFGTINEGNDNTMDTSFSREHFGKYILSTFLFCKTFLSTIYKTTVGCLQVFVTQPTVLIYFY